MTEKRLHPAFDSPETPSDRYQNGPSAMNAYLPGGALYTGAVFGGDEKLAGPVKVKRTRKPKKERS